MAMKHYFLMYHNHSKILLVDIYLLIQQGNGETSIFIHSFVSTNLNIYENFNIGDYI